MHIHPIREELKEVLKLKEIKLEILSMQLDIEMLNNIIKKNKRNTKNKKNLTDLISLKNWDWLYNKK